MPKIILEDDFDEEMLLYGIKTDNIKEYKFIYLINKLLSIQFKRIEDLDVTFGKSTHCFSTYQYFDEFSGNDCHILKNTSHPLSKSTQQNLLFDEITEHNFLLKRYNFYNFFLKLNGNITLKPTFALSLQKLDFIQRMDLIELTDNEKRFLII